MSSLNSKEEDDDCIFVEVIKRGSPSVLHLGSYKENQRPDSPRYTTPSKRRRQEEPKALQRTQSPIVVSGLVRRRNEGKTCSTAKPGLGPSTEIVLSDSTSSDDDLEVIKILGDFDSPPEEAKRSRTKPESKQPYKIERKFARSVFPTYTKPSSDSVLGKVNNALQKIAGSKDHAISSRTVVTPKNVPNDDLNHSRVEMEQKLQQLSVAREIAPSSAPACMNGVARDDLDGIGDIEEVCDKLVSSPIKLPTEKAEEPASSVVEPPPMAVEPPKPVEHLTPPLKPVEPPVEPKLTPKPVSSSCLYDHIIKEYEMTVKAPAQQTGSFKVVSLDNHFLTSMLMAHYNSTTELEHISESLELIGSILNVQHLIGIFSGFDLLDRCVNYYLDHKQANKISTKRWLTFFTRLSQLCEFVDTSEQLKDIESASQQELSTTSSDLELYWRKFLNLFQRLFNRLVYSADELNSDNELHVLSRNLVVMSLGLFAKFSRLVFAFKRCFKAKNTNWLLNTDKNNPFYLESAYFHGSLEQFFKIVTTLLNTAKSRALRYIQIIKSMQQFLMIALHCGCLNNQKTRVRELINFLKRTYEEIENVEDKQAYLSHLICFQEIRKRVCVELLIGDHMSVPKNKIKADKRVATNSTTDWEHSIVLDNFKAILAKSGLNGETETESYGEYLNTVRIYLGDPLKHETVLFRECFDSDFESFTRSINELQDSVVQQIRLRAGGVANFLGLAKELVLLAQSVSSIPQS